jgi:hypothetical protein
LIRQLIPAQAGTHRTELLLAIGSALLGVFMKRHLLATVVVGLAMLTGVAVYAASSAVPQGDPDGPLCPICRIIIGH